MKYIYYNQYLINRDLQNFNILVSKIKGGYLIGPKITDNFDEESFYRRVKSSAKLSVILGPIKYPPLIY